MPPETKSIPVILPDKTTINGLTPIVFVGPNGSGKTRLGMAVANSSQGTRIPALRSLAFGATIQPRVTSQAKQEVDDHINRYSNQLHIAADEIHLMLSELKAEHSDVASQFLLIARDSASPSLPAKTSLERFMKIWEETFPGRTLDFSTYEPRITSILGSKEEKYQAHTMSDGERVAIYLIARVLRAKSGVIVIDEPEVHFHGLLARMFWDRLQLERPDCRFVYITHDLPFALSRRGAAIGIVKSSAQVEMIDRTSDIPAEIFEQILGAASLSLVAKRIVFTEGVPGTSIDAELYGAWFQSPDTAVVQIGNCRDVQNAVRVFQQKSITSNATAIGIVERDYFPDRYLKYLQGLAGLHVLPVHEVEGLLCLPKVAEAIAKHQGIEGSDFNDCYARFEDEVRQSFVSGRLHKHLLERIKQDIDGRLDGMLASPINEDPLEFRKTVANNLADKLNKISAEAVFDEQMKQVEEALKGPAIEFLKVLPGKDCFQILLRQLGVPEEMYLRLLTTALAQFNGSESSTFKRLEADLIAALSASLPTR